MHAGETTQELIKRLANDMKLNPETLLVCYEKRSQFKEANIFSGSYSLPRSADENTIITILFDVSNQMFEAFQANFCHTEISKEDMNIFLTMASIIQKESNDVQEMSPIRSIICNRLLKDMKLQMDDTLNYGKYSYTIVTSERIKHDISTYNTHKYKGIPSL